MCAEPVETLTAAISVGVATLTIAPHCRPYQADSPTPFPGQKYPRHRDLRHEHDADSLIVAGHVRCRTRPPNKPEKDEQHNSGAQVQREE